MVHTTTWKKSYNGFDKITSGVIKAKIVKYAYLENLVENYAIISKNLKY